MKITIECTPKEMADFVLGLQNQPNGTAVQKVSSDWVLEGDVLKQKQDYEAGIRLAVWEPDVPSKQ